MARVRCFVPYCENALVAHHKLTARDAPKGGIAMGVSHNDGILLDWVNPTRRQRNYTNVIT